MCLLKHLNFERPVIIGYITPNSTQVFRNSTGTTFMRFRSSIFRSSIHWKYLIGNLPLDQPKRDTFNCTCDVAIWVAELRPQHVIWTVVVRRKKILPSGCPHQSSCWTVAPVAALRAVLLSPSHPTGRPLRHSVDLCCGCGYLGQSPFDSVDDDVTGTHLAVRPSAIVIGADRG